MKPLPEVPLQDAWRATHGVNWQRTDFDLRKAFLCAAFSELVYRHVRPLEVGDLSRMWMVPCRAYQQIASGAATSDFEETLRRMEAFEQDRFFFNTGNIVGVGIRHRGIIIVALRGTQDFHDLMIDLLCNPFNRLRRSKQALFHRGFRLEAERCLPDMLTRLQTWGAPDIPVYLTGHSLGGAIAGIMMAMQSIAPQAKDRSIINSAYTFGMPRYGNKMTVSTLAVPYPTVRDHDPVPWMPPEIFGYSQCPIEYGVRGNLISRSAVGGPISRGLFSHHAMEEYRKDLHLNFP